MSDGNPLATCPHCGARLDGYTDLTDKAHTAKEGDFSFCLYCRRPLVFRSDLTLRVPTDRERAQLAEILKQ